MADYTLQNGTGTTVNVDGGAQTGQVDIDATALAALTEKTAPSDDDMLYLFDSAASNALKKAKAIAVRKAPLLHVEDRKTSGTDGGGSSTGAWYTRDLNTVVTNEIFAASLIWNQIRLPAGTYYVEADAPFYRVDRYMIRLRNVTDGANVLTGTSEFSGAGDVNATRGFIRGRFTLDALKMLELQYQCSVAQASNGLGSNVGGLFAVDHETYSVVRIWKIA